MDSIYKYGGFARGRYLITSMGGLLVDSIYKYGGFVRGKYLQV